MKKKIIHILKWSFLIGVLATPLLGIGLLFYAIETDQFLMMGAADTIAVLGNGKYEIGKVASRITLEDYRFDGQMKILVGEIDKYVVKNDTIYIIGDYGDGYSINKDGIRIDPYDYYVFETGELKSYKPDDLVAHYVILNFETDNLRKYVNLEGMPEADQLIFRTLSTTKTE